MTLSHVFLFCLTVIIVTKASPNTKYWEAFDVLKICKSGIKQSPINLVERSTIAKSGSPITFMNYDVAHNFSMKNTGKTAKLSLKEGSTNVPTITSSHLSNDTYKFAQLHFHWGDMDKYGSEHVMDGFQYPIEVHLLTDIQSEGSKVDVKSFALEKLLPTDLNTFFSYEGSLTTPRCNEVVAWTVFKKKHMMSSEQLGEFRKLIGGGEPLVNNYRDVQDLNGRQASPNTKYWEAFDVLKICKSGIKQSPINLVERSTIAKSGSPITFMNYDVAHNFSMKNTGKTAKLSLKEGSTNVPTITSSHLSNDTYKFAQLHFHWGDMDKYGSEHVMDGFQYPIEVHLVHLNTKYGATIEEALSVANKSDNLALTDIQSEGSKVDVKSFALEKLLPTDLNTFFSYEGSLTTPRCNEVVAWTVFKKKHMMSSEQLGEFRKLIGGGEPLVNNYRDVQDLNGRQVDFYSA
ncbi:unnamed protein product [Lepeophtheirus salmonis]|uniref:Carbonic anhydrase n=1 Tax=Lepeophtheirus salmonis TaxID=72036 RepID=A0A7R8CID1_LEPSM|nr:unnamed protein product [Lepeophtheirus salmonis]CAF2831150.1 unnamed protein product [Lepeophtheirus salmonis]